MKNTVWNYIWGALLLTGMMACSDTAKEELSGSDPDRNGLELTIAMESDYELNARTELVSSEAMHHIEHLYAYLFAATGNPWTGDETCIYEEKLPWQPGEEAPSSFRCRLKTDMYDALEKAGNVKELMLLVVGVDNHPETYTFPAATTGTDDPHLNMTGKPLNQVKMELATGIEPGLMSYTEVFGGFTRFGKGASTVKVDLIRRVAGVLCYLTDIPAKIGNYSIVGVQLHCQKGVNVAAGLQPDLEADPNSPDYRPTFKELDDQKKADATLLAEANLKDWGAEPDESRQLLYIPPVQETEGLHTKPNTVLMGAYMIPIQAGATFDIRLVGEEVTDGKVERIVFDHTQTEGYYPVKDAGNADSYAIRADYIYQIGIKPQMSNTDYDDPLSLKGEPMKVEPAPWKEQKVDVDFPNTQLGVMVTNGKSDRFRYDCMADTDHAGITVTPQYANKEWELSVSGNCDWLWIITEKDGKKEMRQTLKGVGAQTIEIYYKDHFDANSKYRNEPDKDYRRADLVLKVLGTPIESTCRIRQWNALIVTTCDEDNKKTWDIAFRRLDNGAYFDPQDGTMKTEKVETYNWEYNGIYPTSIFDQGASSNTGDDGLKNYEAMLREKDQNINKGQWENCVVNLAHREIDGKIWYVPARIELHALMYHMGDVKSANLGEEGVKRWSATAVGGSKRRSYASDLRIKNYTKWWIQKDDFLWDRNRDEKDRFRVRLARKITNQLN